MNKIEITQEFKEAFDKLENSSDNVFITGRAGTGKSTFLQYFRRHTGKNVVVLAPTGVAALNVRGQTIHSFFKIRPGFIDLNSIKEKRSKIYKKIDILIIDEISMVRADLFDAIERFLSLNGPRKGAPFGGVQVCVIGDMYQLPPIVSYQEREIFHNFYPSPFFFDSHSYARVKFDTIELSHNFRQTDHNFISYLNRVREGERSNDILEFLNQRHLEEYESSSDSHVVLTAINKQAEHINQSRLHEIEDREYCFTGSLEGKFSLSDDRLPAPENLLLKRGAQVMFTKNDPKKRWVNGTIGIVKDLSELSVTVTVDDRNYIVERETWESVVYDLDPETGKITEKIIGSYKQLPLILAWAVTIHKSQGKTLDSVVIDLGRGAFAPGQLYVALSRCREFNKIILKQKITYNDIKCDQRVVLFSNEFCT